MPAVAAPESRFHHCSPASPAKSREKTFGTATRSATPPTSIHITDCVSTNSLGRQILSQLFARAHHPPHQSLPVSLGDSNLQHLLTSQRKRSGLRSGESVPPSHLWAQGCRAITSRRGDQSYLSGLGVMWRTVAIRTIRRRRMCAASLPGRISGAVPGDRINKAGLLPSSR